MSRFTVLSLVWLLSIASSVFAQDIIIESRKEGKNNDCYKETGGQWLDSQTPGTSKSTASGCTEGIGSRKVALAVDHPEKPAAEAVARFTPKFKKSGRYYVYATWSRAANVRPARYVIKHANGQQEKPVNQDGWGGGTGNESLPGNGNSWVALGQYEFSSKGEQYVELHIDTSAVRDDFSHAGQAFSDAVLFSTKPQPEAPAAVKPTSTPQAKAASASSPAAPSPSTTSLMWFDSIPTAQNAAAQSGRMILVFFFAPTSRDSQALDNEVFANAQVKTVLSSDYVLARINLAENRSLGEQLQVFRAATVMIYDKNGKFIKQIKDRMSPEEFLAKLK